jgi:hypothetical protein
VSFVPAQDEKHCSSPSWDKSSKQVSSVYSLDKNPVSFVPFTDEKHCSSPFWMIIECHSSAFWMGIRCHLSPFRMKTRAAEASGDGNWSVTWGVASLSAVWTTVQRPMRSAGGPCLPKDACCYGHVLTGRTCHCLQAQSLASDPWLPTSTATTTEGA